MYGLPQLATLFLCQIAGTQNVGQLVSNFIGGISGRFFKFGIDVFNQTFVVSDDHRRGALLNRTRKLSERLFSLALFLPNDGFAQFTLNGRNQSGKIMKMVLPYEPTTARGAIACATPISPGMELYPNSPETKEMREAVLESLLINHPLDCPICDQAGECKLQEYSVEHGQARSRFVETKVHKPKAVDLGPRIVLDDERCVLCTRCIRFTRDIAGDDALGIVNRGSYNTIAAWKEGAFDNNYTLNTVDICPVGALTSKDFRFQMRVWFLKETQSICTSCGTGCNIVAGSREGRVYRYEPRENDAVNGPWMCDAGRLNYRWVNREDRLQEIVNVRTEARVWSSVIREVADHLNAQEAGSVAVIGSGRQSTQELYLLKQLAESCGALTDIVPRKGEGDQLVVAADKNPNTNGAYLTGMRSFEPPPAE